MSLITTIAGACSASPSCTALGYGNITYWTPKKMYEHKSTGTVVVVHIINTVANTTRISTIAKNTPPGFMPPPTNSGGTRTFNVMYERSGTWSTTPVTYPTPFIDMPTAYTIQGDYQLGPDCVQNANKAYPIPINLQPAWRFGDANWNISSDPNDELGWNWRYGGHYLATLSMDGLIKTLPDDNPDMPHSVVSGCKPEFVSPEGGPSWALSVQPYWGVVGQKSISYEGQDGARGNTGGATATGTSGSPASDQKPTQNSESSNVGSATVPWLLWTAAVWVCSAVALGTVL